MALHVPSHTCSGRWNLNLDAFPPFYHLTPQAHLGEQLSDGLCTFADPNTAVDHIH